MKYKSRLLRDKIVSRVYRPHEPANEGDWVIKFLLHRHTPEVSQAIDTKAIDTQARTHKLLIWQRIRSSSCDLTLIVARLK